MTPDRPQRQSNTDQLLRTKLAPPLLNSRLVRRPSLLARLDEGMAFKVILIAAPPGYGKSTLTAQWLADRKRAAAWVSLDAGDNDPVRFWRYVITACRVFDDTLGKGALAMLRSSQQLAFEPILTAFINELTTLDSPSILVLEDYHVITTNVIHETVTFLLDHLPPMVHLVLLTRSEPPIGLARLRARNELFELNALDLNFSPAETQVFVEQNTELQLSQQALTDLYERTEGWAAGLRLMTLALQGRTAERDTAGLVSTPGIADRLVTDYLIGEVLASQSQETQQFLIQTSILDRLTGSLCDAVTGTSGSAALLEQLARANLFLIPLEAQGSQQWYRFHTLFAEALRLQAQQRLGETVLQELHGRAAEWYTAHGLIPEAIDASLAARAFERAAALIERTVDRRGIQEVFTLRRWIEQLPSTELAQHPELCFGYAQVLLFSSDRFAPGTAAQVEGPLRMAEEAWHKSEDKENLGRVLALRSTIAFWQGDPRAFAYARRALELLPEQDTNWRGISLFLVGIEQVWAGKPDYAQPILLEARALSAAAQNAFSAQAATLMLADVYQMQMEPDQATQLYQQVLAQAGESESMLDDRGQALLGLGSIAFERNDLATAEKNASTALEIAQRRSDDGMQTSAAILLARVLAARGQTQQARERLNTVASRIRHKSFLRQISAVQARIALAAGDLTSVERWSEALALQGGDVSRLQQEQEELVVARMHLANGRPTRALERLQPWRADAREHGRVRSELEILCLQALAHFSQSHANQANQALVRALTMAQSKNYIHVCLDEGEPMQRMISQQRTKIEKQSPRLRAFTFKILSAFSSAGSAPAPESKIENRESQILFEPLSPQEERVLRLLAAGLSNPQIARELIVSTNTIKTQIQSIYRKLNVNNRQEARDVARQLNLG